MRRLAAVLIVTAVVSMASDLGAQTKPGFAGDWTRDAQLGPGVLPEVDLTITQDAAVMTVEYKGASLPPGPHKLTYKLDGSASKNVVAGRGSAPAEQVSKATLTGNKVVVTTSTAAGEEKRTFSTDGTYLVVETSAPARQGRAPNITTVTYKKYERGHGG